MLLRRLGLLAAEQLRLGSLIRELTRTIQRRGRPPEREVAGATSKGSESLRSTPLHYVHVVKVGVAKGLPRRGLIAEAAVRAPGAAARGAFPTQPIASRLRVARCTLAPPLSPGHRFGTARKRHMMEGCLHE